MADQCNPFSGFFNGVTDADMFGIFQTCAGICVFQSVLVALGNIFKTLVRRRRTSQMIRNMDWDNFLVKTAVFVPTIIAGIYAFFYGCSDRCVAPCQPCCPCPGPANQTGRGLDRFDGDVGVQLESPLMEGAVLPVVDI